MSTSAQIGVLKGDVTRVHLTADHRLAPAAKGRPARTEPVNIMRVFLRDRATGREAEVSFVNSTVGVHEGHVIAVARAKVRGARAPVMLALINETTGQREEFPDGFRRAARNEIFGPRWKALGLSVAIFIIGWLGSLVLADPTPGVWRGLWPLFLAFLSFPALWAVIAGLDSLTRVRRDGASTAAIRAEIARQMGGPRDVTPEIADSAPATALPPPRH